MSKVCKFCSTENDNSSEFCSKCEAKLPNYTQFDGDLGLDVPKTKRLKINYKKIFYAIIILVALFFIYKLIFPALPEDKLPYYEQFQIGKKSIARYEKSFNSSSYNITIRTTAPSLSAYLTSLVNKIPANKSIYDRETTPRIILSYDPKDNKKISVIKRDKAWKFIPLRAELIFKNNNGKWNITGYKINNSPILNIKTEKIIAAFFSDITSLELYRKLNEAEISLKFEKTYLNVKIQKRQKTTSQKRKSNGLLKAVANVLKLITSEEVTFASAKK